MVFFELLTGYKPYHTRTGNYADLRKELDADVPQLPPELSYLQALLNKLPAKDPADRYQSAGELLKAVQQYSGNSSSLANDATIIQQAATAGPVATILRRKPGKIVAVVLLGCRHPWIYHDRNRKIPS